MQQLDANVTIGWSAPGGTVCVYTTTADYFAMDVTVSLNCTYNGSTVVFCVQFISNIGCTSETTISGPISSENFIPMLILHFV